MSRFPTACKPGWAALSQCLPWLDNVPQPHRLSQNNVVRWPAQHRSPSLCHVEWKNPNPGLKNASAENSGLPVGAFVYQSSIRQTFDTIDIISQYCKGILNGLGAGHIYACNFENFHGWPGGTGFQKIDVILYSIRFPVKDSLGD